MYNVSFKEVKEDYIMLIHGIVGFIEPHGLEYQILSILANVKRTLGNSNMGLIRYTK